MSADLWLITDGVSRSLKEQQGPYISIVTYVVWQACDPLSMHQILKRLCKGLLNIMQRLVHSFCYFKEQGRLSGAAPRY